MRNTSTVRRGWTLGPTSIAAAVVVVCLGATVAAASALSASSRTAVALPRSTPVLTPSEVPRIVASDTTINNQANATLSIPLQDSHETCLEQVLDDATYRGQKSAGSNSLGESFNQVPGRAFVPRDTGYPAVFSSLVSDRATAQPTTNDFLTYVKTSASARWKLALSSQILGPTNAGVAVPAVVTDAAGYVTSLDPASNDGLLVAPNRVGAQVATAFTAEAKSGKLPAGISAQFGPNGLADPHTSTVSLSRLGTVTTQFTTATPKVAAAGAPSRDCTYPAYRLTDGGALVTFAVFSQTVVRLASGTVVIQPPDRSALGALLSPGRYSSVTTESGDMALAVVPPAGSRSSIEVIGQASEILSETGVSGSAASGAVGAPANAASIAKAVDSALVDINTTLNDQGETAAGTGMVFTSNGEVVTNNHVIEGETSISVTDVGNGKTYGAKVVGYDRTGDVAVLQLENASGLQTVVRGDSSKLQTGQPVVGVGNAGGTGGTPSYTGGSITALDQSITASDSGDGTSEQLSGLIETNADIQPGDSGGPLVSTGGKVLGMDTAASGGFSYEQEGSLTSSSFSIPINTVVKIAGEITAGDASSTVHIGPTAFLGVQVFASSFGGFGGFGRPAPTTTSGAEIESVVSGSPAAQAGLIEGDTITSLDGQAVTSPSSLTTIVDAAKPGSSASVAFVDASGVKHTATVHLGSGPPQ